jgi:hypothetical protein
MPFQTITALKDRAWARLLVGGPGLGATHFPNMTAPVLPVLGSSPHCFPFGLMQYSGRSLARGANPKSNMFWRLASSVA